MINKERIDKVINKMDNIENKFDNIDLECDKGIKIIENFLDEFNSYLNGKDEYSNKICSYYYKEYNKNKSLLSRICKIIRRS